MRGRKPKPNCLKLAIGSRHAKDPATTPTPDVAAPPMPEHLTPEAQGEWHRIVREMQAMGTLASADLAALTCYVQAWGRLVEAEQHIAAEGAVVTHGGEPVTNPWLRVSNWAVAQLVKLAAELGLSPTSRSRLHVAPQKDNGGSAGKSRFFPNGPTLKIAKD